MAKLENITVNISLNGPLDVEKLAEEFKASIRKEIERVGVKVEPVQYRKVTDRKPKAGDFVKFIETEDDDVTVGKYYEIIRFDFEGDPEFYDNDGDLDVAVSSEGDVYAIYEKVVAKPIAKEAPKPEPLKVGDYVKITCDKTVEGEQREVTIGEIRIIKEIDNDRFPYYAEKLDGSDYGYFRTDALVRATDEEVAEAKAKLAEAKWTKIGRKPNEFKKGDIVRVDNPCGSPQKKGQLAEVIHDSVDVSSVIVNGGWAVSVSELVAPVESRVDRRA